MSNRKVPNFSRKSRGLRRFTFTNPLQLPWCLRRFSHKWNPMSPAVVEVGDHPSNGLSPWKKTRGLPYEVDLSWMKHPNHHWQWWNHNFPMVLLWFSFVFPIKSQFPIVFSRVFLSNHYEIHEMTILPWFSRGFPKINAPMTDWRQGFPGSTERVPFGVAFSGGGVRAAAFHCGLLRPGKSGKTYD